MSFRLVDFRKTIERTGVCSSYNPNMWVSDTDVSQLLWLVNIKYASELNASHLASPRRICSWVVKPHAGWPRKCIPKRKFTNQRNKKQYNERYELHIFNAYNARTFPWFRLSGEVYIFPNARFKITSMSFKFQLANLLTRQWANRSYGRKHWPKESHSNWNYSLLFEMQVSCRIDTSALIWMELANKMIKWLIQNGKWNGCERDETQHWLQI